MLKVLKAGFYTTVQDLGRFGYRHMGVPVAGTMDSYSASIANTLLENDEGAAVLEITMTGPKLEFTKPTFIAISGADISPQLNEQPIRLNQVHKVSKGDMLSFGKLEHGFRAYLAVKDGFDTEIFMKSRSLYKSITRIHYLKAPMEIAYKPVSEFEPKISGVTPEPFHKEYELEVLRGPEYHMLDDKQLESIFSARFTIAKENDRMAYQLKETIPGHEMSMLTSATLPGTIQFTPAGKLIILMKDGQTTGGYPRILQLSNTAICILSQKKSGDTVKFQLK